MSLKENSQGPFEVHAGYSDVCKKGLCKTSFELAGVLAGCRRFHLPNKI